jgi:mannose-6-phosphate isomerase-like protein (cupin superfamily)
MSASPFLRIAAFVAFVVPVAAIATAAGGGGEVRFLDAGSVAAAFQKGAPLIEVPGYKIHASRRTGPGQAEIHTRDTDILHVLEGSAVIVTGGEVEGGRETAPEEIRGSAIRGGTARELHPGDVMVVPDSVPHWFREVNGPFLYYVVKVPTGPAVAS